MEDVRMRMVRLAEINAHLSNETDIGAGFQKMEIFFILNFLSLIEWTLFDSHGWVPNSRYWKGEINTLLLHYRSAMIISDTFCDFNDFLRNMEFQMELLRFHVSGHG